MKKLILAFMGAILLVSLIPSTVLADPPEGLVTSNPKKNIVRDPLIDGSGSTSGWVTFACGSLEGFEYSVAVKGLTPDATYTVRAESLSHVFMPFPPFSGWVPTIDGAGNTYSLVTIQTDSEGEGEVTGLVPLGPPGFYGWEIIVADDTGDVLWTIPSVPLDIPGDPADFSVLQAWP